MLRSFIPSIPILNIQFSPTRYKERYEDELYNFLRNEIGRVDSKAARNRKMLEDGGSDTKKRRVASLQNVGVDRVAHERIKNMREQVWFFYIPILELLLDLNF